MGQRRARPEAQAGTGAGTGAGREELDFLLGSLRDLEREHTAGDLADEDYRALSDRYGARAASLLRAAEPEAQAAAPQPPATPILSDERRPRRRWLLVAGSALVLAGVALWVVADAASSREAGQTPTGGATLNAAQQTRQWLGQAEAADAAGRTQDALGLYEKVLVRDPKQPEALAEAGWLEFSTGVLHGRGDLVRAGQQLEQQAVAVAPQSWAPHLYLGSMDFTEGDASGAVGQFEQFVRDGPPAAQLQAALATLRAAFAKAGVALPNLPSG